MERDAKIFMLDRFEEEARMWTEEASIALSQLMKATEFILADEDSERISMLNRNAEALIKQKKGLVHILNVIVELKQGPTEESFLSQCEATVKRKGEYDESKGREWDEWREVVGEIEAGISIVKNTVSLTCPITLKLYEDPYTSQRCGHSYSKKAIYSLIGRKKSIRCPVIGCNVTFGPSDLIPGVLKGLNGP